MAGKMALYRECCFPKCKINMVKKVIFLGFRGVIARPVATVGNSGAVPLQIFFVPPK